MFLVHFSRVIPADGAAPPPKKKRQSPSTACTKSTTTRLPIHTASRTISYPNLSRLISCSMVNRRVARERERRGKTQTRRIQRSGRGRPRWVFTAVCGTMRAGWDKRGGWRVEVRVGSGGLSGWRVCGGMWWEEERKVKKRVSYNVVQQDVCMGIIRNVRSSSMVHAQVVRKIGGILLRQSCKDGSV